MLARGRVNEVKKKVRIQPGARLACGRRRHRLEFSVFVGLPLPATGREKFFPQRNVSHEAAMEASILRYLFLLLAVVVALWTFAVPVHAYLDPGTGNTLLQGLIASVAVAAGVVVHYWPRIRTLLPRSRGGQVLDGERDKQ
jgi:hypothetical protein